MVILDDSGQYAAGHGKSIIEGDRWTVLSVPIRYESLGQKRNCSAEMAMQVYPDANAYGIADDDDLYLPWHIEASVAALKKAEWSRPSRVLHPVEVDGRWRFNQHYTGGLYHGGWAYRRETFERMGGYRPGYSGPEDKELMLRMDAAGVTHADPIALDYLPSYIYPWGAMTKAPHISGMLSGADTGQSAWNVMGRLSFDPAMVVPVDPPWFDVMSPIINNEVLPRPF
jgi:hypothetical protein